MSDPAITRHGAEVLDELRPLWLALRDHHADVMPHLGPPRDDDASWAHRRAAYARWLADPRAFVLLARAGGALAGYALVRPGETGPTWPRPERPALLETLSVLPSARGGGIGSALLARVRGECRREGYDGLVLGAMAGNADAVRFYEREGFEPRAIELRDATY